MSTYKVTLADGTEIEGLTLNGNNFVSLAPIDESVFEYNTEPVIITRIENGEEFDEEHEHMALVQISQMGEEYWFILRDLTSEELKDTKVRADIDYIAMMSDIELED